MVNNIILNVKQRFLYLLGAPLFNITLDKNERDQVTAGSGGLH